jgi:hypothetical protein
VAVECAHRRRERYDVVWWVRAENPLTLLGDYAALADALALPEREEREQNTRAAAVTTWLERHPRWLLVFDNAPSPDAVRELIPRTPSGHVLITSRQQGGWRGIADPVAIDVWSREESLNFLSQRTGDKDAAAATAIAEALADLPLALEQAAAYVDSNGISLAGYQHRLESQAPALFQRGRPADYEHTIATTWELAFAELEQDPGCAALLFCCAFFAPERIPRELFLSETIANGVFAAGGGELALDELAPGELVLDERGVDQVDPGGCGGRGRGPGRADGGEGKGDGAIDEVGGGAVERIDVEPGGAAAARDVLVDDDGEAGAAVAALAGRAVGGEREVLDALDDAPRGGGAAEQLLDEALPGDHARLREARTRPRVRTAGAEIERQVGWWPAGPRGTTVAGVASTASIAASRAGSEPTSSMSA